MKIGILVTTYQCENTITRTLKSIRLLVDSLKDNIEFYIYVIDDCSTDKTFQIAKNFNQRIKNFSCYKFNDNAGVSRSRNYGINISRHCDFITFVDSGDEFVLSSSLLNLNLLSDNDIICFDHIIHDGVNENYISHLENEKFLDVTSLSSYIQSYLIRPNRYSLLVTCWGKLYSTKLFSGAETQPFKTGMALYEDALFLNKLIRKKIKIYYLNKPLYIYNNYTEKNSKVSISLSKDLNINQFWNFIYPLRQLKWFLIDNGINPSKAEKLFLHCVAAYSCISIIRICYRINLNFKSTKNILVELNNFISRKIINKAFYFYNVREAQGNKLLANLIYRRKIFQILIIATIISKVRY
jgi:glycosyltransferase involved in cell wall biosynthesis